MLLLSTIVGLVRVVLLIGWQSAADTAWAVTLAGCVWIGLMTWICLVRSELRTQRFAERDSATA